jgi:hypothetical protein
MVKWSVPCKVQTRLGRRPSVIGGRSGPVIVGEDRSFDWEIGPAMVLAWATSMSPVSVMSHQVRPTCVVRKSGD